MAVLRDFTLLQPRAQLDSAFYDRLRATSPASPMRDRFTIPPFQGRGFIVRKGQSFRVVQVEGVQIGDVTFWNADHPRESYSLARTWAIEGWVVRPYTRVWSDVPWLRPMATCIEDTVVGTEREFHHHWLGTHCATEWTEMRVAIPGLNSCHLNLLQAIEPFGLTEANLRDNINLFQKMKVEPDSGRIVAARSESKRGDYIEFYAELDLLVAVSVCPNGDNTRYYSVPERDIVRPLGIEIYDTGVQPQSFPAWTDWRPTWTGQWTPPA
jgi:uncharacterized protein